MTRGYHWTVAVCATLFSVAAFATDYTWTGGGGDDIDLVIRSPFDGHAVQGGPGVGRRDDEGLFDSLGGGNGFRYGFLLAGNGQGRDGGKHKCNLFHNHFLLH